MKSKQYNSKFLIGLGIVFTLHFVLFSTGMFHFPLKSILSVDSFLLVLFILGTLIVSPGLDKAPDNFVNRFLILTTMQLMVAMFAILIMVVKDVDFLRPLAFHLLGVFLCLMTTQSVLLVKTINKN